MTEHSRAAISGIGYSDAIGRDTGFSESELAVQACRNAIADAGLDIGDIDGLSMYPTVQSPPDPFDGPDLQVVQRSLGSLQLRWYTGFAGHNSQLFALLGSIDALIAGRCRHVLCYRAHLAKRRESALDKQVEHGGAYGEEEHTVPYGAGSGTARGALWAARYMHEFNVRQEALGAVGVNSRAHAATNPRAYWRTPTTIEEYLASRFVATPLKLLDVDFPIDGAVAVVLSRVDAARDTRRPVGIAATGVGPGPATGWLAWRDKTMSGATYAARQMWDETILRPADVDVAEAYDGFSYLTLMWLEELGLKEPGRAGEWLLEGGGRVGTGLAVNTDGGQLGVGRLHGFSRVTSAVEQLRGEAINQVADAEVAVACSGAGPDVSTMLFTRDVQ